MFVPEDNAFELIDNEKWMENLLNAAFDMQEAIMAEFGVHLPVVYHDITTADRKVFYFKRRKVSVKASKRVKKRFDADLDKNVEEVEEKDTTTTFDWTEPFDPLTKVDHSINMIKHAERPQDGIEIQ